VPANLTPEYHDAEEKFKRSESTDEKVSALEEMLRVIPKHKGTEKMQADLKRRLSKLRKTHQKEKASGAQRKPFHYIEKEGIGRVVFCGPPNGGKSCFLSRLTHAEPEVADFPFTTRAPLPGMMSFEDVQIQLVDTPPIAPETLEPWLLAMVENADIAVLVFDVTDPFLLEQTEFILARFEERGIELSTNNRPRVVILGNKVDRAGGAENFRAWKELFEEQFLPVPFSTVSEEQLSDLRKELFELLQVVRVYTKAPGAKRDAEARPYVLKQGSTVVEAANAVHKDLASGFKYARIWGREKYDGQMVERDYVLQDGDLLEVHAS
jgi:ribosome-interacting GTPase 1